MRFSLGTYNLLDFFPPDGPTGRAAYEAKLDSLVRAVAALDVDVLGLQEVGGEGPLAELVQRLPGRPYQVIRGTPDARGIAVALLSRLPVRSSHVHTTEALPFPVFVEGDPPPFGTRLPLRRGVVAAEIDVAGTPLHVFVVHLKSGRPAPRKDAGGQPIDARTAFEAGEAQVRTLVMRTAEALFVRKLVDDVIARSERGAVAVVGDFNDVAGSASLRVVEGRGAGELFDATLGVAPEQRHTLVHFGQKRAIDHVLVSARLRAHIASAHVHNEALRDHDALRAAGFRVFDDSDHAPVTVAFEEAAR